MTTILLLLNLAFIVVSSLGLAWFIFVNLKKDRELAELRDLLINRSFKSLTSTFLRSEDQAKQLNRTQVFLDRKVDALSNFIDERNTYVTWQQEQFQAFAKSDMLTARRNELIRSIQLKEALERIMSMAVTSRQPPAVVDALALEAVTKRIEELESILKDS